MSTESQYYRYNPEKRNIFIETHTGRTNIVRQILVDIFMLFASPGSAIVEVFLRRKFGERYITLSQSLGIFLVFSVLFPVIYSWYTDFTQAFGAAFGETSYRNSSGIEGASFVFLVLFMLAFLGMSIYHRLEIKRYGTAYDLKRFSLSDGEILPFWWNIIGKKIGPIKITTHLVKILLEPLVPIVLGLFLTFIPLTKPVGVLLLVSGLLFMLKNFNMAQKGRDWVLDNIDKQISNQMRYDVFIGRKPKKDTKGVYLPMDLPEDPEVVQSLYEMVDTSFKSTGDFWVNDELDDTPKQGENESGGMVSSG